MLLKKSEIVEGQTIKISGSKSETNRLLVLEKLFGNIKIDNASDSQDSDLLRKALNSNSEIIDIHHAGTAMRFLASYYAIQEGRNVVLTGSDRMKQRPIGPLVEALRSLGADINYVENFGFPPLKINGKCLSNNRVKIPAGISSQFITSLMLVGAKLNGGLTIEIDGNIASRPYIDMTQNLLKSIGIDGSFIENEICIKKAQEINSLKPIKVESDWSSASYFYSIVAIGRKTVSLETFKKNSLQGDSVGATIFKQFFGVETMFTDEGKIILKPICKFKAPERIELDMNNCPDIAQTVCVTATALKIPFSITGLGTLKVKETDRLLALKTELAKLGCKTAITDDSIESTEFGEPDLHISIKTYNDHRMAMSFAPYCLIRGINIENPEVVEKSYISFWSDLSKILE